MAEENWKISGDYFEVCSCQVTCPCNFLSLPTEGHCDACLIWGINEGSYGQVDLAGQKVAVMAKTPEHMIEGGWTAAIYIDEGANQDQREALQKIYSGQAGGIPKVLVSFVRDLLGVRFVPIELGMGEDRRNIRIPDILTSETMAIEGNDGNKVFLNNPPLTIWLPQEPLTQAKSIKYKYKDYDLNWEWDGRHALYSSFNWTGPSPEISPEIFQSRRNA